MTKEDAQYYTTVTDPNLKYDREEPEGTLVFIDDRTGNEVSIKLSMFQ